MILIIMITSTISLIMVGAAVFLFDRYHVKKDLVIDLTAISRLISDRSSAALAFQEDRLATENLSALSIKPDVVSAWILDRQNHEFARYGTGTLDTTLLRKVDQGAGSIFTKNHLIYIDPIKMGTDQVGTLLIFRSLEDFHRRIRYFILFVFAVIVLSSIIALILSTRLQLYISKPLFHLTGIAKHIAVNKDYSKRAEKTSEDEIGLLVASFNDMLDIIEVHNTERKLSEETMRYERLLLRTLIDNMPDAI
jgi:methyl-accepting chemotaxis protein